MMRPTLGGLFVALALITLSNEFAMAGTTLPGDTQRMDIPGLRIFLGMRGGFEFVPAFGIECFPTVTLAELYAKVMSPLIAFQGVLGQSTIRKCLSFGVLYWQIGASIPTRPLYFGFLLHGWLSPSFRVHWMGPFIGLDIASFYIPALAATGRFIFDIELLLPMGEWFTAGAVWGFLSQLGVVAEF